MALNKITDQHGFDAAALRESQHQPEFEAAWNKRRDALKAMRQEINDLIDEVNHLKAQPSGGSSFLQPPASS
jgi:hypothetical protein